MLPTPREGKPRSSRVLPFYLCNGLLKRKALLARRLCLVISANVVEFFQLVKHALIILDAEYDSRAVALIVRQVFFHESGMSTVTRCFLRYAPASVTAKRGSSLRE